MGDSDSGKLLVGAVASKLGRCGGRERLMS